MSLINQMLQDLEQRSVGDLSASGLQKQIRAVPERGGVHKAWWLVLALTVLLVGVCAWFGLRPAPPPASHSLLNLKMASDLSALPSPAAETPSMPAEESTAVDKLAGSTAIPDAAHDAASDVTHKLAPIPAAVQPPAVNQATSARKHAAASGAPANEAQNTRKDGHPAVAVADGASDGNAAAPKAGTTEKPPPAVSVHNVDSTANSTGTTSRLDKQVKELTPQQHAENAYRTAAGALQQGHQADAITDLQQAIQFDPSHTAARQMLVGLLLAAKRNDEATRLAQEGLALDPAQIGLAMILARVQLDQGSLQAALDTLQHSLPHAQEHADYRAFLAALLQRDKRHKDAIEQYSAALGKEPQNGVWWMGLGISLQAENRLQEAKEAFGRAKATNTLSPQLQVFVDQKLAQLR